MCAYLLFCRGSGASHLSYLPAYKAANARLRLTPRQTIPNTNSPREKYRSHFLMGFTQSLRSILRTKDGRQFFEIQSLEIVLFSSSQLTTSGSDWNYFYVAASSCDDVTRAFGSSGVELSFLHPEQKRPTAIRQINSHLTCFILHSFLGINRKKYVMPIFPLNFLSYS